MKKWIAFLLIILVSTSFICGEGAQSAKVVEKILGKFSSESTSPYLNETFETPFQIMKEEFLLKRLIDRCDPFIKSCQDPLEIVMRLFPILTDLIVTQTTSPTMGDLNKQVTISAERAYYEILKKYHGFACGGKATFFVRTLNQLYHIPAFSINTGTNGCSHVISIVPIKERGSYRFYVFDTYNGCYLTHLNGDLIDIEALLSGAPFQEKLIYFKNKVLVNPTNPPWSLKEHSSEVVLNPTLAVYSFPSWKTFLMPNSPETLEDHTTGNYSWEFSIPFFTFGNCKKKVIGMSPTNDEVLKAFYRLLDRYFIEY